MNSNNFKNVTMKIGTKTVKSLDGVFYENGVALKNDGTDLLLRVIMRLFDNCKRESFDFLIASTYVSPKIEYSFDFIATDIESGLPIKIEAKAENVIISFDQNEKVKTLICNLSFTIIGENYRESMTDLPMNVIFTDYGTTTLD